MVQTKMGSITTCIYRCGCTSVLTIPDELTDVTMKVSTVEVDGSSQEFEMQLIRCSSNPSVFLEVGDRPEFAKECHTMTPFDVRGVRGINWLAFERMAAPYRKRFGSVIPTCWLPDLMAGRGRFFGMWAGQVARDGRRIGHLYVVENEEPESEPRVISLLREQSVAAVVASSTSAQSLAEVTPTELETP